MNIFKYLYPLIFVIVFGVILAFNHCRNSQAPYTDIQSQGNILTDIEATLLNNPPNSANSEVREKSILDLDNILKNDSSRTSEQVINFYSVMMEKINTELTDTDSVTSIWMMYNHGIIIKTPEITFAFDLVPGYSEWPSTLLPKDIVSQIEVLFISHEHQDHYSSRIKNSILNNEGYVVVPSENAWMGNIEMSANDTLTLKVLKIKAYAGLHSVPLRIFEVTTPNGIKFVHTGDNQTSLALPTIDNVDVLLLNAWVNESGNASAVTGMRNSLFKLNPTVMIPGHIQELGHSYRPADPTSRVPYEWAFQVDDELINSEVVIMTWGERYLLTDN